MSEAFLQMAGVFSQLELAMIRARVRSGMENARAKGRQIGRPQVSKEDIPATFLRHYPTDKSRQLNVSEMARVCDISLSHSLQIHWTFGSLNLSHAHFTWAWDYAIISSINLELDEVFRMKLRLVKASNQYRNQISDMLNEWNATDEKIIPYAIRRIDYHDFAYYCDNLEVKDASGGLVPDSTFFCLDEERNVIVGAVNIRHYLNESLLLNGGHIGDGVRPSERRKGIATKMIALALEECRKLGIEKVLMVCDKENVGSAKSIQNNGGILENEVEVDGVVEQRYWIELA